MRMERDDRFWFSQDWNDWCGLVPKVKCDVELKSVYDKELEYNTYSKKSISNIMRWSLQKTMDTLKDKKYDAHKAKTGYRASIIEALKVDYPRKINASYVMEKLNITAKEWKNVKYFFKIKGHNLTRHQYEKIKHYVNEPKYSTVDMARELKVSRGVVERLIAKLKIKQSFNGKKRYSKESLNQLKTYQKNNYKR